MGGGAYANTTHNRVVQSGAGDARAFVLARRDKVGEDRLLPGLRIIIIIKEHFDWGCVGAQVGGGKGGEERSALLCSAPSGSRVGVGGKGLLYGMCVRGSGVGLGRTCSKKAPLVYGNASGITLHSLPKPYVPLKRVRR